MLEVLQRYWNNIERAETDRVSEFWVYKYFTCKNYAEAVLDKNIIDKDDVIMFEEEE